MLRVSASVFGFGFLLLSSSAFAQSRLVVAGGDEWSSPGQSRNYQQEANKRHLGVGLSMFGFIAAGRWEIANGGVIAMDVVWRKAFSTQNRIELGGMARLGFTPDALLISGGIPLRLVLKMHERLEVDMGLELSYTRIKFGLPLFPARNGFTATVRWELGYFVDPKVCIGITPVGFSLVAGERVDSFVTYEPGIWARFSPI